MGIYNKEAVACKANYEDQWLTDVDGNAKGENKKSLSKISSKKSYLPTSAPTLRISWNADSTS